jgi:hypothetical protein
MTRPPHIPEKYLLPVDLMSLSDDDLRRVIAALCAFLNVHVLKDETPETSIFEVRRIRRKTGRSAKAR